MLKRITQTDNAVICLKLREDLFILAQMRHKWFMQFFDLTSPTAEFDGVDLNKVDPLFCIIVAEKPLLPLMVKKIDKDIVTPNARAIPKKMLSAIIEPKERYGANLIELTETYSSYGGTMVKADLTIQNDLDDIYRYELAGMVGNPEKLRKRLLRYFETGVNWDESKEFLFKRIGPPPPYYHKKAHEIAK